MVRCAATSSGKVAKAASRSSTPLYSRTRPKKRNWRGPPPEPGVRNNSAESVEPNGPCRMMAAPTRHSTECSELIQCRLGVSQDEFTGFDQGPPRGYVVAEDLLVRQHVMCGPHEMHANHPAGPQQDKEPDLCHPSHDRETPRAREREGENPVKVDYARTRYTSGCDLERHEKEVESPYRRQFAHVDGLYAKALHLAVQQVLIGIRLAREEPGSSWDE